MDYSPLDHKESNTTEHIRAYTHTHTHTHTPEGTLSSQPLDFSPLRMNLDFDLQNYKIINLLFSATRFVAIRDSSHSK